MQNLRLMVSDNNLSEMRLEYVEAAALDNLRIIFVNKREI